MAAQACLKLFSLVSIWFGVVLLLSSCGSSGSPPNITLNCPMACSKPAAERVAMNKTTGFTDNTGFAGDNQDQCCDICAIPNAVHIPNGHNGSYDWDYIVMSSMYVPQFCAGLNAGHDITVTNVAGSKCQPGTAQGFQIHGLWPNYKDGFAACCLSPTPLGRSVVDGWDIDEQLRLHWSDPAVDSPCGACFNLNHEWQKHGGCFTDSPLKYFGSGLNMTTPYNDVFSHLANFLQNLDMTSPIHSVAILQGKWLKFAQTANIPAMKISVMCDHRMTTEHDGKNVSYLSEIHTCWERKPGITKGFPLTERDLMPVDCPATDTYGACGENFTVYIDQAVQTTLI